MAPRFAALIAAAGSSTRMGSPKALMPMGSKTALNVSLDTLSSLVLSSIFVTLPPSLLVSIDDEAIFSAVHKTINRFPDLGYFGSIKTVIEILIAHTSVDGLFIVPVDAPLRDRHLLYAMMIVAKKQKDPAIIVPYFHERPGHPVYLSRHFFDDLKNFVGTHGLRAFIATQRKYERALFWPDQRILANHNYPTITKPHGA